MVRVRVTCNTWRGHEHDGLDDIDYHFEALAAAKPRRKLPSGKDFFPRLGSMCSSHGWA